MEDEFDDDWIKELEEEGKEYYNFLITTNDTVKIKIFYINNENVIFDKISKNINIKDGIINRFDMIKLIKDNIYFNKKNYKIMSILSYNFNLDNNDVRQFYKKTEDYDFLTVHKGIDLIKWEDTLNYFKELNELILFFVEKKGKKNKTKRIYMRNALNKTRKNKT
tara:strand:- start:161 stop:655 length:495 start_codon:yes stop_codon:yes gene_type:complete